MQQLQQRFSGSGQWFRLGIVSATIISPLLSRWRSLRAAERARALWEASRANTSWTWPRLGIATQGAVPADAPIPDEELAAPRMYVRPGLWLAGVGVGLAVAGAVAFVVARRRLQANEAPIDIPWPDGTNGHVSPTLASRTAAESHYPRGASPRTTSEAEFGPSELSSREGVEHAFSATTTTPLAIQSAAHDDDEMGAPTPLVLDEDGAAIIGDTTTRLYRSASAEQLPAPEQRIFFASAEQAEAAGYQPDPTGAPPANPDH